MIKEIYKWETIDELRDKIDLALDFKDKETFMRLSQELNINLELQKIINI